MNIFIPQSAITQYELLQIADAKLQVITPGSSKPLITLVQDSILGVFKLTLTNNKIKWNDMMNLLSYLETDNIYEKKVDGSGKELFSFLLHNDSNLNENIKIINGQLTDGHVNGDTLNKSLISYFWDKYGVDKTKNFIDNVQKLILNWLMMNGMTVGYEDTLIKDKNVEKDIKNYIEEVKLKVSNMITELENNPELNDCESFEISLRKELESIKNNLGGKIIKNVDIMNNFRIMVESKSKGSNVNFGSIIGSLGQEIFKFERIKKKVNNRTLPHFYYNDDSADARGFITNSYREGLNPKEFFFHLITGREGLIDTAIKSVSRDTKITIQEDNIIKIVNIGDWIDNILNDNNDNIQIDEENNEYREYCKLDKDIFIPSTDLNGYIKWEKITAITRHNPSKRMYRIKTLYGRQVSITDSHSLLIWNKKTQKLERLEPTKIVLGDQVPVTLNIPKLNKLNKLNKSDIKSDDKITNLLNESESEILNYITKIFKKYYHSNNKNVYYYKFNSNDEKEIYHVNMILNRIGLFGEIVYNNNDYSLIISNFVFDDNNIKYKKHNDIVLDEIIEIVELDGQDFNKVYDLTVPNTLNFGISNGLHVVDTSNTGYLQRKIIKSMEDIMVCYDGTVRNAVNNIVQFCYSNSNFDQTKHKKINLEILKMDDEELVNKYVFTDKELKELSMYDKKKLNKFNDEYKKEIFNIRNLLRNLFKIFKTNQKSNENDFFQPVNYKRIIDDIINDKKYINKKNNIQILDPFYVYQKIEYILKPNVTKLFCLSDKQIASNSMKVYDDINNKTLFKIALHEYIAPKRCIFEYKLSLEQFDILIDKIIYGFNNAIVEAGEMVGVLTGQSFGEPLTQMTTKGSLKLLIKSVDKRSGNVNIIKTKIGQIIDKMIEKNQYSLTYIKGHIGSIELDLKKVNKNKEYFICSISNDKEINEWRKISHVSRHPANGQMVKIKTLSGKKITTTLSHSHLKRTINGVKPVEGKNLKIGDRIPISKRIKMNETNEILTFENGLKLDINEDIGWLMGAYLAEGSINKNQINISNIDTNYQKNVEKVANMINSNYRLYKYQGEYGPGIDGFILNKYLAKHIKKYYLCGSFNKKVPTYVHKTNLKFVRGLLRGYFDGDGNINALKRNISCSTRSKELMEDISFLLKYFGIYSSYTKYYQQTDGNKKPLYQLHISGKYAKLFYESIGSDIDYKIKDLKSIIESESELECNIDFIDKLPVCNEVLYKCGQKLHILKNNRSLYKFGNKGESVGRRTVEYYIDYLTKINEENKIKASNGYIWNARNKPEDITLELEYLKMSIESDVIWDEIIELTILDDPKEYVYDLTIPGTENFMLYNGILTHNTLNSVDWNEKIYYRKNDGVELNAIGKIVDDMLDENKDKILCFENSILGKSELLDIKDKNYYTTSVDDNGKMSWKKIEAITRHDPNGKLVKIITKSGRKVSATKGHSFLVYENGKVVPKLGSEIIIGDKVPIMYKYPESNIIIEQVDGVKLNYENGYKFGYCKFFDPNMLLTSIEFVKGFISGYIDIKYIENDIKIIDKKLYINNIYKNAYNEKNIFSLSDEMYIDLMSEIFSKINIFTSYSKRKIYKSINEANIKENVNGLIINNYNLNKLLTLINLKENKLIKEIINKDIIKNNLIDKNKDYDVVFDEIKEIIEIDSSHDKVYDLTIQDTKNFTILGGLCVRDTFHSTGSGVKGMQGIPRFGEILNYSKNIKEPYMTIYLKPEYSNNYKIALKLASNIIKSYLIRFIEIGEIIYDPIDVLNKNDDNYLKKDKIVEKDIFYWDQNNKHLEHLSWLFRFKLNHEKLLKYDISLLDIKTEFIKFWIAGDFLTKKKKKESSKMNNVAIGSTYENVEEIYIHIRFDIFNIDMDYLYELYDILVNKFSIKGIPNIIDTDDVKDEYHISYDENGKKIEKKEYVIYTNGINFNELKNYKVIDFKRTICNDVQSNYKYNGLEAAKKSIIREIEIVFSNAGKDINYNHIELFADIMTNTASITSIDRHGVGRMDIEPLGKASFEKTFEQFVNAAIFNEVDHLKNVSSRIMVGKSFLGGTGLCELLLDTDIILNSEKGSQYKLETMINYIKENVLLKEINNRNIDELYIP